MHISVNWLRELVPDLQETPEELADRLSMQAVPVDGVVRTGERLEEIVVARVLEVVPHPNADRLLFCRVEAGGEPVQLVCGAPVVLQGARYPYVPPGGRLPGGLRIESREIRGVMSHGMLCSEHELGLGRDKGGIMQLPPDLSPGEPLAEGLGLPDALLAVDLTPNRVDLACHVGVARELAPGGEADLVLRRFGAEWEPAWKDGETEVTAAGVRIRIEAEERCSRYLAALVRGVRVGPSPAWLAGRLRALGLRPVNNVVDATNYVLLESNQPLHAFDLGKLRGPEIRVRPAEAGERLRTLDGELRVLPPAATAIADREGAVAIAGVMGGEESEVTEGTTEILLECAAFPPLHVRHSAREAGLSTDASFRFERGVDERGQERALVRCVELILATAGGEAEEEAARVGRRPDPTVVRLRRHRIRQLLGIEPEEKELRALLEPIGFRLAADRGRLSVGVPGWRRDVTAEIDLIEEVARRVGYDRFPEEPRRFRPSSVPDDPAWERSARVRRLFAGRGFLEARSSSFVPREQPGGTAEVQLLNPLSAAEGYLRAGIVPVLLRWLEHNWARGRRDVRLYEIGTAFSRAEGKAGLERFPEELRVGALATGLRRPLHWERDPGELDIWDLKGLASEVATRLCGGTVEPMGGRTPEPAFGGDWLGAEGFCILQAGRRVGIAGRVADGSVDAPPWAGPTWALEFRLDAVLLGRHVEHLAISPYPAVRRDLAVTVPNTVRAADLEDRMREETAGILDSLSLFDLYAGEGIESARRSLAWAFRFRAPDRTLTDEEVEEAMRRIISMLEEEFDARVRAG